MPMGSDAEKKKFVKEYYGQLVGAKVKKVTAKVEDMGGYNEVWPVITFTMPDGQDLEIEVSQDEEGNGPGFLFGLTIEVKVDPNNPPPQLD